MKGNGEKKSDHNQKRKSHFLKKLHKQTQGLPEKE